MGLYEKGPIFQQQGRTNQRTTDGRFISKGINVIFRYSNYGIVDKVM
jgi:hypothetical protein